MTFVEFRDEICLLWLAESNEDSSHSTLNSTQTYQCLHLLQKWRWSASTIGSELSTCMCYQLYWIIK